MALNNSRAGELAVSCENVELANMIYSQEIEGVSLRESARMAEDEFDQFWRLYPLRVGKLAAVKAYAKARKTASQDEILQGVSRYVEHKPEWQAYAHPATWLNQGRWADEPFQERRKEPRSPYAGWNCPHTPKCGNTWRCAQLEDLKAFKERT